MWHCYAMCSNFKACELLHLLFIMYDTGCLKVISLLFALCCAHRPPNCTLKWNSRLSRSPWKVTKIFSHSLLQRGKWEKWGNLMKTNTLSSHHGICSYVWYPITSSEVTTVPYCQETNIIRREITHQESNTLTEMQLPGHLWDFQSSVRGCMCAKAVNMCITALMFRGLNWILCWRTVNLEYVQDANDWCDCMVTSVGSWCRTAQCNIILQGGEKKKK